MCNTCSPMTFKAQWSLPHSLDSEIRFGKIININLKERESEMGSEKEREANEEEPLREGERERREVNDRER